MDYQQILEEIAEEIQPYLTQGQVAQYIPALTNVEPNAFAMSIQLLDGSAYHVGSYDYKFSIQSISKVFSFTEALRLYGADIYKRVGREPSGDPFNSLVQLEHEGGIPRNPFINAGAIVTTDTLFSHYQNSEDTYKSVEKLLQNASGDNSIGFDRNIWFSEYRHGHRNLALANFMKSFGNIHNEVDEVVKTYFKHCSIMMNTDQLSRAMLFFANGGSDPISNQAFISSSKTKRINSLMLTCGHYDASGDFAFHVGLPGKSGVGGGIVAIVPNVMAIAVYSPRLNQNGNSLAGTKALEFFTTKTSFSIF
ncbi:MAG: glutaminase [Campylobacterales bacterium]|nr:glutaminase [Campylobacterales bacterium]